jgi:cytochrome c peroxidase
LSRGVRAVRVVLAPPLLAALVALGGAPPPAAADGRDRERPPATGLDRPYPARRGEPPTPARVELGRLLFFDPILSADRDLSCAHCHHPQRALSDGRARARGRGGRELRRNTPSLYNVGWRTRLFWDGRAADLETQALGPLLAPDEMGADPAELVERLRAVSGYRARFAAAFPAEAEPIHLGSVVRALAAFQRTLVSQDSRYDRYARGRRDALSPAERRGLTLLRSLNTRCFECHPPPTFDMPHATGIGVPSPDGGAGAVEGVPQREGFFQIPSLRNAARTGPYMHDGSLATLEDVVRFYARGGGHAFGVDPARIDDQIRPFTLADSEVADLVAFLGALSDESASPAIPDSVPSGLPVVEALPPAARPDPPSPPNNPNLENHP